MTDSVSLRDRIVAVAIQASSLEMNTKLLFLTILTFWLVWTDWRHRQLPILGLILLIGVGLSGNPQLISSLILGITAFACWRLGYCGSGDVYLLLACGLWIPLARLPLFCVLAGILIGFWGVFERKQCKLPLAPSVLLAQWIVVIS